MRPRWHLLKASLLCNVALFAAFALTVYLLFYVARLDPDAVLGALTPLQAAAGPVLDLAGQVGVFADSLAETSSARPSPAHPSPDHAALGPTLYRSTILLGLVFGLLYEPLLPRVLAWTTTLLRTDRRTARELEREAQALHDRIGGVVLRLLLALYLLYVSDIGSRFSGGQISESLQPDVTSRLLLICLMTYLMAAVFFSGLFGLVRRAKRQLADLGPATDNP